MAEVVIGKKKAATPHFSREVLVQNLWFAQLPCFCLRLEKMISLYLTSSQSQVGLA